MTLRFKKSHAIAAHEMGCRKNIPADQEWWRRRIDAYGNDKLRFEPYKESEFSIRISGKTFDDKKEAGEALMSALRKVPMGETKAVTIGDYCGFELHAERGIDGLSKLYLQGDWRYPVELGTSETGNLTRLHNILNHFDNWKLEAEEKLEELEKRHQDSLAELERPFEQQDELNTALAQLSVICDELGLNEHVVEIGDAENESSENGKREAPEQDEEFLIGEG